MPAVRTLRPTENPKAKRVEQKNGILRKGSLEHTNRERRFRRYDADSGTRSLERRRMIWRLNPLVGTSGSQDFTQTDAREEILSISNKEKSLFPLTGLPTPEPFRVQKNLRERKADENKTSKGTTTHNDSRYSVRCQDWKQNPQFNGSLQPFFEKTPERSKRSLPLSVRDSCRREPRA